MPIHPHALTAERRNCAGDDDRIDRASGAAAPDGVSPDVDSRFGPIGSGFGRRDPAGVT